MPWLNNILNKTRTAKGLLLQQSQGEAVLRSTRPHIPPKIGFQDMLAAAEEHNAVGSQTHF